MKAVTTLLIHLFLFPSLSTSTCYYPDGSVSAQDTPCEDGETASTCCGQGYACLSNNICMATGQETQVKEASPYVRGSCTDQTWRSSKCPLFCINPDAPNYHNLAGGQGIAKCDNTAKDMYYCIDYNYDATNCTAERNVLVFQGTPTALTTIGVTQTSFIASSTALATSTTVSTSSPESTTSSATGSPSNDSSTHQRAIGIAAGVPTAVVVCLLGIGAFIFFRRRKRKDGHQHPVPADPYYDPSGSLYYAGAGNAGADDPSKGYGDGDGPSVHEAPGDDRPRYELPGWREQEMMASRI